MTTVLTADLVRFAAAATSSPAADRRAEAARRSRRWRRRCRGSRSDKSAGARDEVDSALDEVAAATEQQEDRRLAAAVGQAGPRRVPLAKSRMPRLAPALRREVFTARRRRPPGSMPFGRRLIGRRCSRRSPRASGEPRRPKSRPACSPIAPVRQRLLAGEGRSARRRRHRLRAGRGPGGAASGNQGCVPRCGPRTRRRTATCFGHSSFFACCRSSRLAQPRTPATSSRLDGPLSLFGGHTRYGLAPRAGAARDCLVRCVGKSTPTFSGAPIGARCIFTSRARRAPVPPSAAAPGGTSWRGFLAAFGAAAKRLARRSANPPFSNLPGAGLCVPDLAFVRDG